MTPQIQDLITLIYTLTEALKVLNDNTLHKSAIENKLVDLIMQLEKKYLLT